MKLKAILFIALVLFTLTNRLALNNELESLTNKLDDLDYDSILIISYGLNFHIKDIKNETNDFKDLSVKTKDGLIAFIIDYVRHEPLLANFENLTELPHKYANEIYELMKFGLIDSLMPEKLFNDIM
jgi:hypothetical protein